MKNRIYTKPFFPFIIIMIIAIVAKLVLSITNNEFLKSLFDIFFVISSAVFISYLVAFDIEAININNFRKQVIFPILEVITSFLILELHRMTDLDKIDDRFNENKIGKICDKKFDLNSLLQFLDENMSHWQTLFSNSTIKNINDINDPTKHEKNEEFNKILFKTNNSSINLKNKLNELLSNKNSLLYKKVFNLKEVDIIDSLKKSIDFDIVLYNEGNGDDCINNKMDLISNLKTFLTTFVDFETDKNYVKITDIEIRAHFKNIDG